MAKKAKELTIDAVAKIVAEKGIAAAAAEVEGRADLDRARQVEIRATLVALNREIAEIEKRLQTRAVVLAKAIKKASTAVGVRLLEPKPKSPPAAKPAKKTKKAKKKAKK